MAVSTRPGNDRSAETAEPAMPAAAKSSTSDWSRQVLCRYYLNNVCQRGEECPYSHDRSTAQPENTCQYYLKGNCYYGDKCRFDHVKPPSSKSKDGQHSSAGVHKPPVIPKKAPDDVVPHMTTLKKKSAKSPSEPAQASGTPPKSSSSFNMAALVDAVEFVPGMPYKGTSTPSYLAAAQSGLEVVEGASSMTPLDLGDPSLQGQSGDQLCPYLMMGSCPQADSCPYLHGLTCDLCGLACLHPTDSALNEEHRKACIADHEQAMEHSFAVQRSREVACGICMEVVMDKALPRDRKFGILSGCSHAFCLECIRRWRSAKHFNKKTIRGCPECRQQSDFVTPSPFWVETKEQKDALIESYKAVLKTKKCKHFDEGRGSCPFASKCFYRHQLPDGTLEDPASAAPPRRNCNASGLLRIMDQFDLWDFLEARDLMAFDLSEDEDDLLFYLSDDDDESIGWNEIDAAFF